MLKALEPSHRGFSSVPEAQLHLTQHELLHAMSSRDSFLAHTVLRSGPPIEFLGIRKRFLTRAMIKGQYQQKTINGEKIKSFINFGYSPISKLI